MSLLEEYQLARCKYIRLSRVANKLVQKGLECAGDRYGIQIAHILEKAYHLSEMRAELLCLRKKVFFRIKKINSIEKFANMKINARNLTNNSRLI